MPTTTIRVDSDLLQRVESLKPKYISTTGFFQLLAEQALDTNAMLGSRTAGDPSFISSYSSSKAVPSNARALPAELVKEQINRNPDRKPAKKKDIYASKNLSAELVPADLQQHAELLVDFWSVKKGTRSERAWDGLLKALRAMTPENQGKALTAAYNAGWATVYEPTDTPKQGKWKEPETNHPAHKVFKADDLGPEWDVPSVTGGKGVLEGMF
jgi:hypothetical protein